MIGLSLLLVASIVPSNTGKAIGTLIAGFVLTWELWRTGPWKWHPLDASVLGLLLSVTIATATAHFVGQASNPRFDPWARMAAFYPSSQRADGFVIWLTYGLAALVAQRLTIERAERLSWWAVNGGIIIMAVALFQAFGIELTHYVGNGGLPPETRVYGTLGNPIFYGVWAAAILPLVVHLGIGVYAILLVITLAATWSRAAWLGAGVALAVLRPPWRAVALLTMVFSLAVVGLTFRHHDEGHITDPTSVTGRWQIWTATAHLIGQRPWFGYGTGTMALRLPLPQAPRDLVEDNPHNELLYVAYSFGLVGLLFYLWMWGTALSIPNIPRPFLAALSGYFVAVQFSWSHIGVANWLFVLLGLTVPLSGWTPAQPVNWGRYLRQLL